MQKEDERKRGINSNRDHPKRGREKEEGGPETGGRLLRDRKGVGAFPSSSKGSFLPRTIGPFDSMCLSSPKQAVVSSQPNFWPHSLQIHCNGLGPKTVTLQLAPSVGSCLCNDKCDNLLRQGQTPKGGQ